MAQKLSQDEVPIEPEVVIQAMQDAFAKKPPALEPAEMQTRLAALRKRATVLHNVRTQERSAKSRTETNAFLEKNRSEPGVVSLPSGLQYKVVQEGEGQSPSQGDRALVRYRTTLLDGTELDNTYGRPEPVAVPVAAVMKGWTEALPLMKPGAKWRLYVHPSLGSGDRRLSYAPANSLLIFDLELIAVEKGLAAPQAPAAAERSDDGGDGN